jgi:hypothetical protein
LAGNRSWPGKTARQPGCNPEAGHLYVVITVNEHIRGLNVLMNKAAAVDLAECYRQANNDAQHPGQIEWLTAIPHRVPLKNPIQGLTARVGEYENRPPFVTSERQRLGCPRRIEFRCKRVFVL